MRVQLFGCGTILQEVHAAADILREEFNVAADIWSATSFNELARDGRDAKRHNMLNPTADKRISWVEQQLAGRKGPVIAASDYMSLYANQIREFVPATYITLGTDGFGRSDTRKQLRNFFEVDRHFIVVASLYALVLDGELEGSVVDEAIKRFDIDPAKANPLYC